MLQIFQGRYMPLRSKDQMRNPQAYRYRLGFAGSQEIPFYLSSLFLDKRGCQSTMNRNYILFVDQMAIGSPSER